MCAHLVEVQRVQQVGELAVLLLLLQHHIMLHQAVQRQLGLVVHVDLHGLGSGWREGERDGSRAGEGRSCQREGSARKGPGVVR